MLKGRKENDFKLIRAGLDQEKQLRRLIEAVKADDYLVTDTSPSRASPVDSSERQTASDSRTAIVAVDNFKHVIH